MRGKMKPVKILKGLAGIAALGLFSAFFANSFKPGYRYPGKNGIIPYYSNYAQKQATTQSFTAEEKIRIRENYKDYPWTREIDLAEAEKYRQQYEGNSGR